jgi:DNA primase
LGLLPDCPRAYLIFLDEVLGFGGRTLVDDPAKYLNSHESPIFTKGRVLYGLHETAKFIRVEDFIIVVEGYMDLLALYQAGIKNVVATLGTALTSDHAKLIKRYTSNVVLLFDGDKAGRAATERSLPILLTEGLFVKSFVIPDEKDPDDYVKQVGAKILLEQLKKAPDTFISQIDLLVKKFGTKSTEKIKIID